MKAMAVAALALALAGTPLAAQQIATGQATGKRQHARPMVHGGWDAALVRPQRQAIQVAGRLERQADRAPARLKADVDRLGTDLSAAESQLAQLQRSAVGTQKSELDGFRSHEAEARTHYDELVKAMPNAGAVAQHAAAVRQHLVAAQAALHVTAQDNWQSH